MVKGSAIRILHVENDPAVIDLVQRHLQEAAVPAAIRAVSSAAEISALLEEFHPHVLLSDFNLPGFDGLAVLTLAHELAPQVPLLFVSDSPGEERTVEALRSGARDFLFKSNLRRLGSAVRDVVEQSDRQFDRELQQVRLLRSNRILNLSNTVSGLVTRLHDRTALLQETCRCAVNNTDYTAVFVIWKGSKNGDLSVAASSGRNDAQILRLREAALLAAASATSAIGRVLISGKQAAISDTAGHAPDGSFEAELAASGLRHTVVLPLEVEKQCIGLLVLCAAQGGNCTEAELTLLRDMADHLSFGIESIQKSTMVRFLANFNPHTGLTRRNLFCESFDRATANATRSTRHAVVIVDVEGMGTINDAFGRSTGDKLSRQIAGRMKLAFPNPLELGQQNGGSFLLMQDVTSLAAKTPDAVLDAVRSKVEPIFSDPFQIGEQSIPVSMRIGMAMFPRDAKDAEQLVQHAESALRDARAAGRRFAYYSAEHTGAVVAKLATMHRLRQALERNEFEVYYQPKVNVVTRRLQGVEALLRWNEPGGKVVSPAEFMPLLESSGLILDVGRWAITQAGADCERWQQLGLPPVRVAINVTPAQLREGQFTNVFSKVTSGWSTRSWGLDLEMREGTFQDESASEIRKLAPLRALGVKIAIDGFGTGYSSLGRLASLPVDSLKIDRSFISQLEREPRVRILVRSIVALAKSLGLNTVAEGVENQEQLDLLWHMGCDQSQGYLHSHPVSAEALESLFQHGNGNLLLPPEHEDEAIAAAR